MTEEEMGKIAPECALPKEEVIWCRIIHEDTDGWYFWDETWCNRYGPYASRDQAAEELDKYCHLCLGERHE